MSIYMNGEEYTGFNLTVGNGGSGGTSDHTQLTNRDAANQHPISSINGLQSALNAKGTYSKPSGGIPSSDLSSTVQQSLSKADAAVHKRGIAVVFGDSIFNNGNADPSKASEFGDYLEEQGIFSEVRNFARGGSGFGETYGHGSDIEYSLYNMLKVSTNPHYTEVRQAVRDAETIYMHLGGNDCLAAIQAGEFDTNFSQKCTAVFSEIYALNPAVTIKYIDQGSNAGMLVTPYITDEFGADGAMIFAAMRMFIRSAIANSNCSIKIADISTFGCNRVLHDGVHPYHDAAFNLYEGIVYGGYNDVARIVDAIFVYNFGGSYYNDATLISSYMQLMQASKLNEITKLLVYYDSPERIECYNCLSINDGQMIWQGDAGKLIRLDSSGFANITIGGGSGTSDFDQLTNRPKYNGTAMTHSTNIPAVKEDFVVTFSTTDGVHFTADKTFATTMAAHNSGSNVIFSIPASEIYIAPIVFGANVIIASGVFLLGTSSSSISAIVLGLEIDDTVNVMQYQLATAQ